jgi:hypothetical protein
MNTLASPGNRVNSLEFTTLHYYPEPVSTDTGLNNADETHPQKHALLFAWDAHPLELGVEVEHGDNYLMTAFVARNVAASWDAERGGEKTGSYDIG